MLLPYKGPVFNHKKMGDAYKCRSMYTFVYIVDLLTSLYFKNILQRIFKFS